jgi:hypothetical protein
MFRRLPFGHGRVGKGETLSTQQLIDLRRAVWGEDYARPHPRRRRTLEFAVITLVTGALVGGLFVTFRPRPASKPSTVNTANAGTRSAEVGGHSLEDWTLDGGHPGKLPSVAPTRSIAHSGSWSLLTRDDGPRRGLLGASLGNQSAFATPAYYSAWLLVPRSSSSQPTAPAQVMRWGDPAPTGPSSSIDVSLRKTRRGFEPVVATSSGSRRLKTPIVTGRWAHLELYFEPRGRSARVELWIDTSSVYRGVVDVGTAAERSWSVGLRSPKGSSANVYWSDMSTSPQYSS